MSEVGTYNEVSDLLKGMFKTSGGKPIQRSPVSLVPKISPPGPISQKDP